MKKFLKVSIPIIIILVLASMIIKLANPPKNTTNNLSVPAQPEKVEPYIPPKETTIENKPEKEVEKAEETFNVQIKNQSDILVLVNKENTFNPNFVPNNLVKADVSFLPGASNEEMLMRKEAAAALKNMFVAAAKNGIKLKGVSGYRSYKSQQKIYNEKLNSLGKDYVDKYVALPGQSEHQTGLAMDVGREVPKNSKYIDFGQTKEGIWVKNNAYKFGFILRYPKAKESITKYSYEPWHIRYVGEKTAKEIQTKGLVLEEYIQNIYANKVH
jgi:D-alanyl-D-alanine carboxypeptidase